MVEYVIQLLGDTVGVVMNHTGLYNASLLWLEKVHNLFDEVLTFFCLAQIIDMPWKKEPSFLLDLWQHLRLELWRQQGL